MRVGKLVGLIAVSLLMTVAGAVGQSQVPDIYVELIPWPKLQWGEQNLSFEITNNGDWMKFVTIQTDVGRFEGSYTNPHRVHTKHMILEPQVVSIANAPIDIPGNYGVCSLWVRIYEVVDTLDDISLGTLVVEQPFRLNFRAPEPVIKYRQEKMSVPPLMGRSRAFDSELYRLMFLFITEGKSLDDIARIVNTKPEYVQHAADDLVRMGYLDNTDGVYKAKIPVITMAEAEEVRKLVNRTSDELYEKVTTNLPALAKTIDVLVEAGTISAPGKSTFMEGTQILERPYPLVSAFLFWYTLGEQFISEGASLNIFYPSQLCQPYIGKYCYILHGGDYFNGTHYYDGRKTGTEHNFTFGTQPPSIWCGERAMASHNARHERNYDWGYVDGAQAEAFFYDTTAIHACMRALSDGASEALEDALASLDEIRVKYSGDAASTGVRYWFWNMVSTVTMTKLVREGTIEPEEPTTYHFTRAMR